AFELLWNDYLQNLQDNVINPMNAYLLSFPVLKNKISKRGRKMVDYDNSRHNLEVLQSAKKRDETKIQKAQDELKDVKRIFDELNNELHNELPDFYNSRVTFYAELYSKFFGAENTLHSEVGKTCESITDIAQSLGKDFEHFKYQPKRPISVTDGSVNGETPVATSPSIRSSTSINQSPQKEPMYSNQEQIQLQQCILKPKRKAPVAPGHVVPQVQARVSCVSLETTCSQQSNASVSSDSHMSDKSESLKEGNKYFSRWKERFCLKKYKQPIVLPESNDLKVEQKQLSNMMVKETIPTVSKVQGVKSFYEKLLEGKDDAKCEKRKTASLPDYLKEDKNNEPGITKPASTGKLGTVEKMRNAVELTEGKTKSALSHVSFCISKDSEHFESKVENLKPSATVNTSLGDNRLLGKNNDHCSVNDGVTSLNSDPGSDDDLHMKHLVESIKDIKVPDAKESFTDYSHLKLKPKLIRITDLDDDEVDKASYIVPLDEIAKKQLLGKKSSHCKTACPSSIEEIEPEIEAKVLFQEQSASSSSTAMGVNLQLLSGVRRNDSIKWKNEKHTWPDKEACPVSSVDAVEQAACCGTDFHRIASVSELGTLPTIQEHVALEKQPSHEDTHCKSVADGRKEFYQVAFVESLSSVEDESETKLIVIQTSQLDDEAISYQEMTHAKQPIKSLKTKLDNEAEVQSCQDKTHARLVQPIDKTHARQLVQPIDKTHARQLVQPIVKTKPADDDSPLFNPNKLNFLSQHLVQKHGIACVKAEPNEGKCEEEIPSAGVDAGDSDKVTLKDDLARKHILSANEDVLDEETDKTLEWGSDPESDGEIAQDELCRSASVDLPMKKPKSPLKQSCTGQKVKTSLTSGIPSEVMPESWRNDSMKNKYDIVTVYTEDLSTSHYGHVDTVVKPSYNLAHITTDIVVGAGRSSQSDGSTFGQMMPGDTAITVNVSLGQPTAEVDKLTMKISPKVGQVKLFKSVEDLGDIDTKQPREIEPKSLDKLLEYGSQETSNKLSKTVSLDDKYAASVKVSDNVRFVKSDRSTRDDTDLASMSDSSVSIAVTANETLVKDDSSSEQSVSMASNRWNLRGIMSMLMPVTVQTLASHTKSYINSYLSTNKPSEIDAIEIQKIIAENLTKEDYYNLIGKSRDSSVDNSINLEGLSPQPDDAITTQEEFLSFSSVARPGDIDKQSSFSVDKQGLGPDATPQLSEHIFSITQIPPEVSNPTIEPLPHIDCSDLDILERHFQTVLLDIVTKGSSQLKKNTDAVIRKPKAASKLVSSDQLVSEHSKGMNSLGSESGLNSEEKENSYLLHDAMLSRLQMSLPLLSKSQGKPDGTALSDEGSLDNACSWSFSKESLNSKSSADNLGKDYQRIEHDQSIDTTVRQKSGIIKKKSSEPCSPPLNTELQKSLANRRDALKCPDEDECLTNSSQDDSDHCSHASLASMDSIHSTIILGHCIPLPHDLKRNLKGEFLTNKGKYKRPMLSSSEQSELFRELPYQDSNLCSIIEHEDESICDSNVSISEDSSPSRNSYLHQQAAVIVIEDKDMMDFHDIFLLNDICLTPDIHDKNRANLIEQPEYKQRGLFVEPVNDQGDVEVDSETLDPKLNNEIQRSDEDAEVTAEDEDQKEHSIGDTDGMYGSASLDMSLEEHLKDFGSGDDKDSEDLFNAWDHDEEDVVEPHESIPEEEVWDVHTYRRDQMACDFLLCTNKIESVKSYSDDIGQKELMRSTPLTDVYRNLDYELTVTDLASENVCRLRETQEKRKKRVRFSEVVDVWSGSEQLMQEDGDEYKMTLTLYTDTLNDSDGDVTDDSTDSVRPEVGNMWYEREKTQTEAYEPEACNKVCSEQFINSHYVRDETGFYKQSGVQQMLGITRTELGKIQGNLYEVEPSMHDELLEVNAKNVSSRLTNNFEDVDILVHIQPLLPTPNDLTTHLTLLDEELLAILNCHHKYIPHCQVEAHIMSSMDTTQILTIDGEVETLNDPDFEYDLDNTKNVKFSTRNQPAMFATSYDLSLDNCNVYSSILLIKAESESKLSSSSLGPITSHGNAPASSLPTVKKRFCTCKNVICLGCPNSSHSIKEEDFYYKPVKFTMTLEDALKFYQNIEVTHSEENVKHRKFDNHFESTISITEDTGKVNTDNNMWIKSYQIDMGDTSNRTSLIKHHHDMSASSSCREFLLYTFEPIPDLCHKKSSELVINNCPSTELAMLFGHLDCIDEVDPAPEALGEVKTDETEIGFLEMSSVGPDYLSNKQNHQALDQSENNKDDDVVNDGLHSKEVVNTQPQSSTNFQSIDTLDNVLQNTSYTFEPDLLQSSKPKLQAIKPDLAPNSQCESVEAVLAPNSQYESVEAVLSPNSQYESVEAVLAPNSQYESVEAVLAPLYESVEAVLAPQYESVESVLAPNSQCESVEAVLAPNSQYESVEAVLAPNSQYESVEAVLAPNSQCESVEAVLAPQYESVEAVLAPQYESVESVLAPNSQCESVEAVLAPNSQYESVEAVLAPNSQCESVEAVLAPNSQCESVEADLAPNSHYESVEAVLAPNSQYESVEAVLAPNSQYESVEAVLAPNSHYESVETVLAPNSQYESVEAVLAPNSQYESVEAVLAPNSQHESGEAVLAQNSMYESGEVVLAQNSMYESVEAVLAPNSKHELQSLELELLQSSKSENHNIEAALSKSSVPELQLIEQDLSQSSQLNKQSNEQDLLQSSQFNRQSNEPDLPQNSQLALQSNEPDLPQDSQLALQSNEPDLPQNSQLALQSNEPDLHQNSQFALQSNEQDMPQNSQLALQSNEQDLPQNSQLALQSNEPDLHQNSQFALQSNEPDLPQNSQFALQSNEPDLPQNSQLALQLNEQDLPQNSQLKLLSNEPDLPQSISYEYNTVEADLSQCSKCESLSEKYVLFMPAYVEANSEVSLCSTEVSSEQAVLGSTPDSTFAEFSSDSSTNGTLLFFPTPGDHNANQGSANKFDTDHIVKRDSTSQLNGHKSDPPVTERPVSAPRTLLTAQNTAKKVEDSDDSDNNDDNSDNNDDNESDDDEKKDLNVYEVPIDPLPRGQKQAVNDDSDSSDSMDHQNKNDKEPPNTLYMVRATHKYVGEDVDELSFEAGEIIYVIKFENPDEQDDGWQMGIKQSDNMKGVFPENFTQKLS
ncbi:myc box-dependent-interacting protein 1 isoform X5, partial [Biomphalaria glabrata]